MGRWGDLGNRVMEPRVPLNARNIGPYILFLSGRSFWGSYIFDMCNGNVSRASFSGRMEYLVFSKSPTGRNGEKKPPAWTKEFSKAFIAILYS